MNRLAQFIKINFKRAYTLLHVCVFTIVSPFLSKKHWVISERGTDARDNSWHFYNYMKREHPEQKIYYIIKRDSADYEKVKDDAVEWGTMHTLWLALSAEKFISSHHFRVSLPYRGASAYIKKIEKKFYFLQHGIINHDHPMWHADSVTMRLFVCGALPEYQFISSTFGYEKGIVRYTGLARYDALTDYHTKRQILVMPTWREYLSTSEEVFLASDYYREYQSLLTDDELVGYLEQKNIQLVFYPHYEIQKYLKHFETQSKNVILASFDEYDVQQLLKESALLVTDYSSVLFDFAYMEKPSLYFQFDRDEFEQKHYAKGYFDSDTMGFGKVSFTNEELKRDIIDIVENQFELSDVYRKRIDGFFVMRDQKNCERIYQAILEQ